MPKEWAQDGLLTVFFLVIGLELCQEMATGTLHNPRRAFFHKLSAVGAVMGPTGHQSGVRVLNGWVVPTPMECLSPDPRRFRRYHRCLAHRFGILASFMASDAGGRSSLPRFLFFLVLMRLIPWSLAVLVAFGCWYGLVRTGIHPVLAGVVLGLLVSERPVDGEPETRAGRFSRMFTPFLALWCFLSAFLSVGTITLDGLSSTWLTNRVVLGIMAGLVGIPGCFVVLGICSKFGLRPSLGIRRSDLVVVAQLCGIGFTVAFMADNLAFGDSWLTDMALMVVLAGSACRASWRPSSSVWNALARRHVS